MTREPDSEAPSQRLRMMSAPIDVVDEADAVERIVDAAHGERGHWTITANLDHLRRFQRDPVARALIEEADLVVADGMPLIWASRLAGRGLPERVSGSNMVWSICRAAADRGLPIYLLGGEPGVAGRAAETFLAAYPGLQIVGVSCPDVGFESEPRAIATIASELAAAAPKIVFVALGFPKQDLLIAELRGVLPGASFLGVGISLSYAAGDVARAPDWVCNLGLEWAFRLSQEPTRRLARRYLIDGPPFGIRLLASAIRERLRAERRPSPWNDARPLS